MMRQREQYVITLCGESYTLVSDEGRESVQQSIQRVEALMRSIAATTKETDPRRLAVLAALACAHELSLLEKNAQGQGEQEKHLSGLAALIDSALALRP